MRRLSISFYIYLNRTVNTRMSQSEPKLIGVCGIQLACVFSGGKYQSNGMCIFTIAAFNNMFQRIGVAFFQVFGFLKNKNASVPPSCTSNVPMYFGNIVLCFFLICTVVSKNFKITTIEKLIVHQGFSEFDITLYPKIKSAKSAVIGNYPIYTV